MKRRLHFLVSAVSLATAFIACEKPVENKNAVRLVKQIVFSEFSGNTTYAFTYDSQNKVSTMCFSYFDEGILGTTICNVTYPSVSTALIFNDDETGLICTLNNDRYIVSCSNGSNNTTFEYENGYLIKRDNRVICTWEDGNLISTFNENKFSYNTIPYKEISIPFWTLDCLYTESICRFLSSKCYGKNPKNWISSVEYINENGEPYKLIDYRYELDTEGYVTKIYSQSNQQAEKLMCEIQYK